METTIIWAAVVLIFGIFFSIFFREPIRAAFGRISKIQNGGVHFSESKVPNQEERAIPFEQRFDLHSRSPVQINREKSIREQLAQAGAVSDEEKVKLLIRALAIKNIEAECERVSLQIYGSQLQLLVDLNARLNGMKLDEIKKFYADIVQANFPVFADVKFDDYIGFLFKSDVITLEGDVVSVTEFGVEFMQYLVRTKQTQRRPN